jgi:hypothetical protein
MSFFKISSTSSLELARATIALPANFNCSPSFGTSSRIAPITYQPSNPFQNFNLERELTSHLPKSIVNIRFQPLKMLSSPTCRQHFNSRTTTTLYIKQHQTYGLTSTLLASAPGWSGNTINHSNFSAAVEAIVRFKPLDVYLDIGVKVDDLKRFRERTWKDMSRRMRTGRT